VEEVLEQDSISDLLRDKDLGLHENRSAHSTNLPGLSKNQN